MKKRILFSKNKQRELLEYTISYLNMDWKKLSEILKINLATLSKTYRFEISRIPEETFLKICNLIKKKPEIVLKKYPGKITNDGVIKARKVFGEKRKKLKKINIKYKENNLSLNINEVILTKSDIKKGIKLPNKLTPKLAEEIGMHIGDGYLSDKKREFRLKGNKKDEKEYYDSFIKHLYKDLFGIDLKIKEYETTYGFEIYSTAISEFKCKVIGLPRGRKDNITIPNIVKVNNIKILTSLLRGIFDTDGSIHFQSRYGYKNYYPLISISQKSVKLIKEICTLLEMLGLRPSFHIGKDYASVSLYGYDTLKRYMELIGFHNPKHLKKIYDWKKSYPKLVAMV